MPAADTVLLPLCAGLALLGVIFAGFAWRKGNKGRVIQGAALALAPIALYLTGLLRLLWDAVVAVLDWMTAVVFNPAMWIGLSLLALCVVLFVVGGVVAARSAAKGAVTASGKGSTGKTPALPATRTGGAAAAAQSTPAGKGKPVGKGKPSGKTPAEPIDDEMAEIEALLKARGIE